MVMILLSSLQACELGLRRTSIAGHQIWNTAPAYTVSSCLILPPFPRLLYFCSPNSSELVPALSQFSPPSPTLYQYQVHMAATMAPCSYPKLVWSPPLCPRSQPPAAWGPHVFIVPTGCCLQTQTWEGNLGFNLSSSSYFPVLGLWADCFTFLGLSFLIWE